MARESEPHDIRYRDAREHRNSAMRRSIIGSNTSGEDVGFSDGYAGQVAAGGRNRFGASGFRTEPVGALSRRK
jgi:hypothetical protein